MALLVPSVLLAIGLALLIKGADWLVAGSSSLAKRLGITEMVIGLTVVAFGTSMPEFMVNVISSMGGLNDIVFGNIVGSNTFNILFILGVAGLIRPLEVQRNTVWKEIPFSLAAAVILWVMVNDAFIDGAASNVLSRSDGLILLAFFAIFLVYVFGIAKAHSDDVLEVEVHTPAWTLLYIALGFAGLFVGGKLVVDNAVVIARELSISEKLIALTIIAGGTSLPELATSAVAAKQRKFDIAVGNVVGSNIFNILFILGASALIRPATFDVAMNPDIYVLVFASLLFFVTMFTGERRKLDQWEAGMFLAVYAGYIAFLLGRG